MNSACFVGVSLRVRSGRGFRGARRACPRGKTLVLCGAEQPRPPKRPEESLAGATEAKHRFGGSILDLFSKLRKFPRAKDTVETWNDWFDVLFRVLDHEAFNAISSGRIIFSLVSCGKEDPGAFRIIQQKLRDTDFIEIWYERTLVHMEEMDARSLATSIYSLGVLQQKPQETFLKRWYVHAEQKIETFNSQELSNSICSFARLGFRPDENFLEHWYSAASASLDNFNKQELANVIWSFGKILLKPDEKFFDKWLLAAEQNLPDFYSQNLSNIFYSFSLLQIEPPPSFYEQWLCVVKRQLPSFSNQDLSNVLFAMGKLQMEPDKEFLKLWLSTAEARLSSFNRRDLTNSLQAFAALGVRPTSDSWSEWLHASDDVMGTFNTQELANVLYNFAKLGAPPDESFLDHWFEVAEPKLAAFSTQGLSTSMYSLSRLQVRPPEKFVASYCAVVEKNLDRLTNQALCSVLLSLAKLDVSLTPTFQAAFFVEAESRLADFNHIDLSSILYSFDLLELRPSESFILCWWREATKKLPEFNAQACSNSVYSLSRLGYKEVPVEFATAFVQRVEDILPEFEAKSLAQMTWAIGALDIPLSNRFLQQVWSAVSSALPTFEPKGLVTLIGGINKHQMSPPDFVEREILTAARRILSSTNSGEHTQKVLSSVLKSHGDKPDMPIAQAFQKISRVPARDVDFMEWFTNARAILDHPAYDGLSLTRIIHLLAKFSKKSYTHDMAVRRFVKESTFIIQWYQGSVTRLSVLSGRQLANVIWALGTLRCLPPDDWLAAWFAQSKQELHQFDEQQLVNTMFALSRLGVSLDNNFITAWCKRAESLLPSFDPQMLGNAALALSLAEDISVSETFLTTWRASVLQKSSEFTNEDISNVILGIGRLSGEETERSWLREVWNSTACSSKANSPRDLLKIAEGLMLLNYTPSLSQTQGLVSSLDAWMNSLERRDLLLILHMINLVGEDLPKSYRNLWMGSAATELGKMDLNDLATVFGVVSADDWSSLETAEEFVSRLYFAIGDSIGKSSLAALLLSAEAVSDPRAPTWFKTKIGNRICELDGFISQGIDFGLLAKLFRNAVPAAPGNFPKLMGQFHSLLKLNMQSLSTEALIDSAHVLAVTEHDANSVQVQVWEQLAKRPSPLSQSDRKSLQATLHVARRDQVPSSVVGLATKVN